MSVNKRDGDVGVCCNARKSYGVACSKPKTFECIIDNVSIAICNDEIILKKCVFNSSK